MCGLKHCTAVEQHLEQESLDSCNATQVDVTAASPDPGTHISAVSTTAIPSTLTILWIAATAEENRQGGKISTARIPIAPASLILLNFSPGDCCSRIWATV